MTLNQNKKTTAMIPKLKENRRTKTQKAKPNQIKITKNIQKNNMTTNMNQTTF